MIKKIFKITSDILLYCFIFLGLLTIIITLSSKKDIDGATNIFNYQYIERYNDEHMFIINTNDLIPNQYHIDIRVKQGTNVTYFNNILDFDKIFSKTKVYKLEQNYRSTKSILNGP